MVRAAHLALLAAALTAGGCAHSPARTASGQPLAVADPAECAVIERLATSITGPVQDIADPAPLDGMFTDRRATLADARRKQRRATLWSCQALRPRLADQGYAFSRVAFNADGDYAALEVECGSWFVYREKDGRWRVDTSYIAVHGCHAL